MTVKEIVDQLEVLAPPDLAESWDNPGLLVGRWNREVSRVYVALDATKSAIESAIACRAQMLITHHPMIFSPVKQVNDSHFITRRILTLAEEHMSYYAMHTNYDVAVMGDLAADMLKLKDPQVLEVTVPKGKFENDRPLGIGAWGCLEKPVDLETLASNVKRAFEIPAVKIFGDLDRMVSRVALCPGSGKHMTEYAIEKNCDVLITGDIDHHQGIDAIQQGIAIIDAGHHGIEHIFIDQVAGFLKERFPDLEVEKEANRSPFIVI